MKYLVIHCIEQVTAAIAEARLLSTLNRQAPAIWHPSGQLDYAT